MPTDRSAAVSLAAHEHGRDLHDVFQTAFLLVLRDLGNHQVTDR
jgi:hypothetical protein